MRERLFVFFILLTAIVSSTPAKEMLAAPRLPKSAPQIVPAAPPVSSDDLSLRGHPKFLFTDVTYERSAKRNILNSALTFYFAPEILEATREAASYLNISPDDAVAYVQAKRDVINQITRTQGEEQSGIWRSPVGYTFCSAQLLDKHMEYQAGKSDVTFNAGVWRLVNQDGLGFYSVVPLSNAGTSVYIKARLIFVSASNPKEVARLTRSGVCMPQNTCPFRCRNDDCPLVPPNCEGRNTAPDRWGSFPDWRPAH